VTLHYDEADDRDVLVLSRLRTAAAMKLTEEHGKGHWSTPISEAAVRRGFPHARVLVARNGGQVVGTLRLATKKPWAIDLKYFTRAERALYLTDMAVHPASQRRGVGRGLLRAAVEVARAWPADAIRLDAYDAAAGAGPFYAACGFREVGRASYRGVPLIYFEKLL
jgi:predicted N-acetyltransferase YhbS